MNITQLESIEKFMMSWHGMVLIVLAFWLVYRLNAWSGRILILSYIQKKQREYEKKEKKRHPINDFKTNKIVAAIMEQMSSSIVSGNEFTMKHAERNKAFLYKAHIHLPISIIDKTLYQAIDVVKFMFYDTYGVYLEDKTHGLRNHIDLEVITMEGIELTPYIHRQPIPKILETLESMNLGATGSEDGCYLRVTVSIPTPYTYPKYNYRRFCH